MRIGLLTSWRVPCGVYQFSARLADALAAAEHEPVILAGRADEHRSVPEESEHEVHDVACIGLWRDNGVYSLATRYAARLDLDVIHVQYQSMLFTQPCLQDLAERFQGPLAITFHDNCQAPDFPYDAFALKFTHRIGVGPGDAEVIPFGIENRSPLVRTFGLGRTRADLIAPVCERNGWRFEDASSHEPIHGGGQAWQAHEDLIGWLRAADAVVLWYDDNAAAGSSQAARTALAARRPLVVNDVTWFDDLPYAAHNFMKVSSLDGLETALRQSLSNGYVERNSWDGVAQLLVEHYARVCPGVSA